VDAVLEEEARDRKVRGRRRRDRDCVDLADELAVVEDCSRLYLGRDGAAALGVVIADGDELDAVERAVLLRMKAAEIADSDDSGAKLSHRVRSHAWNCR
jgi:hypothetical protein